MRLAATFTATLPTREDHNSSSFFGLLAKEAHVTSIDVNEIHLQLLLSEWTRDKLSFFGPDSKRYVYNRSSPGLKFSQHFLNKTVKRVLRVLKDHFYLSSSTLLSVLDAFDISKLKLNLSSMCLATPRITLLGTKWKREDLSIPLARYSGLYHLKKPTSIKEVLWETEKCEVNDIYITSLYFESSRQYKKRKAYIEKVGLGRSAGRPTPVRDASKVRNNKRVERREKRAPQ